MAINFPVKQNIPGDIGFEYTDIDTQLKWVWDGYSWNTLASGGASVVASATAPDEPEAGDMWWDTNSGKLKIYYEDENSSQWVDAFNINGALSVDLTGYATTSALNSYAPLASPIFTGIVNVPTLIEGSNIVAAAPSSTQNIDVETSSIWYFTSNSSANFTINFRGSGSKSINEVLGQGKTLTVAVFVTNGGNAYRPTVFQIDGNAVTPKWEGGTAPSAGNTNSVDIYTFSIVKTASAPTYVVFASMTKFA
jgi:hypothetical protein